MKKFKLSYNTFSAFIYTLLVSGVISAAAVVTKYPGKVSFDFGPIHFSIENQGGREVPKID
jgi:hypothetical protein